MPCTTMEPIDNGPHFERLLCYVMTGVERGESLAKLISVHPELSAWWKNHQREDRERLEREAEDKKVAAAKRAALKKLTARERRLLGFNREEETWQD